MSAGSGSPSCEHVLVLSDDIDRAREFYEQALGLRVGDRPPFEFTGYWLYAGATPCLHIADRASYRAHAATLGLEVPERLAGPGPVDHIAFGATDYDADHRATGARRSRADAATRSPAAAPASCSSTTPTGCGSRSTSCRTKAGGDG